MESQDSCLGMGLDEKSDREGGGRERDLRGVLKSDRVRIPARSFSGSSHVAPGRFTKRARTHTYSTQQCPHVVHDNDGEGKGHHRMSQTENRQQRRR